jgi:hypothetical protein
MPCSQKRARLLLERGRAVAVRCYPFTIRLRDRVGGTTQSVRIKLDPGSKTTGIALVADVHSNKPAKVLALLKTVRGFQTGDIVRADIVQGKKTGTYIGRVAVRASGSFNVQTPTCVDQGINVPHCTLVHRSGGYSYRAPRLLPTDKSWGIRRGQIR